MDEKKLEQEYRSMKRQAAPDLWNRIEQKLAEHPEREMSAEPEPVQSRKEAEDGGKKNDPRKFPARRSAYGMAAAAAVLLAVVFANRQTGGRSMAPATTMQETMAGAAAAPMEPEYQMAEITGETAADAAGVFSDRKSEGGALSYEDLELAAYQPLAVPEQAVTVPEDAKYFSEAVLGDTDLLCGGTVTDVSLEQDASGRAVKVVYEIRLDQICYAEDYIRNAESVTVKSPIVETEGDEAYILYQLQKGGTYLLPLVDRDGAWELLYPFAPQIQVTGDGAYLFHSGYASLVSSDTSVVIGNQEGADDYYYDRMLLRDDDNFLSDLISLVEREAQGRKEP